MQIANNILKHYLRDVYFFCGTACGGKTTMSKAFAEKHSMLWLDEGTLNEQMTQIAQPEHQPAWCTPRSNDWETHFNRPSEEYGQWLHDCDNEALPMTLLELVRLSAQRKVAVDMVNMPLSLALELTEPNRIVFLVTTPERVVRDYFDRPSHKEILDCIMGLREPEKALENVNRTLAQGTQKYLDELQQSGLPYIMRDDTSTVEHTLALVEQHFGI